MGLFIKLRGSQRIREWRPLSQLLRASEKKGAVLRQPRIFVSDKSWMDPPELQSVKSYAIPDDLGSDKDQQFGFIVLGDGALEQASDPRQITEEGYLGDILTGVLFENAAEHDGFTVIHQHLGVHLAGVDAG